MLRPTVEASLLAILDFESELCGNNYIFAEWRESFAYEFFICKRSVHFGGVEESNTPLEGCANQRNASLLFDGGTQAKAHAHAAKADGGYLKIASSKFALLHLHSFMCLCD